jgi:predicted nucleic acid-binding protein
MRYVYLDSCIVIYLVEGVEPWRSRIRSCFMPPNLNRVSIGFSDLTRLEARLGPKRRQDSQTLQRFDEFFATPGFRRIGLDTSVFDLAPDLRATHQLKTADALHLAAAISAGCDEFWTNDTRLNKAAEQCLSVIPVDSL